MVRLSAFALLSLLLLRSASAVPIFVLDEDGNGTDDVGSGPVQLSGTLQPDPGPGGLGSALTYTLAGSPPGMVAGDVLINEPGGIMDVVRFNPIGTAGSLENAIVFYSVVGGGSLADTGLPLANYANTITINEVAGVATYTPTASDPGFFAGLAAQYTFTSKAIPSGAPEITATSAATPFLFCLMGMAASGRRRRSLNQ